MALRGFRVDLLSKSSVKLTDLANRRFLHVQPKAKVDEFSFQDIDDALGIIEMVLKKYSGLLLGSPLLEAEPVPDFNTHRVFTFPWNVDPPASVQS